MEVRRYGDAREAAATRAEEAERVRQQQRAESRWAGRLRNSTAAEAEEEAVAIRPPRLRRRRRVVEDSGSESEGGAIGRGRRVTRRRLVCTDGDEE